MLIGICQSNPTFFPINDIEHDSMEQNMNYISQGQTTTKDHGPTLNDVSKLRI